MAADLAKVFGSAIGDQWGPFPEAAVAGLRRLDLLTAPLPRSEGGRGIGTEAAAAAQTAELLHGLGYLWLPLARVFEGHLNAVRLIRRYGSPAQIHRVGVDLRAGHLFGLWAAELTKVRLQDGVLVGAKSFASAAGVASRALVTVDVAGEEYMALVALPADGARVGPWLEVSGMRGAGTAAVDLTGLPAEVVGGPGDYMRQPEISLGAWRALPALSGALDAVRDSLTAGLRRRPPNLLQATRFGQIRVACRTARLWVDDVARSAEADDAGEAAADLVKLARHAVDQCCGVVLEQARRLTGLAGFVRPHPIDRLCRDIDTYRRQPALDEVLMEAVDYALAPGLADS